MIRVVGIRFRNAGKIYFFAPGDFDVKRGSHVIVETARGIEYGVCVNDPRDVTDDQIVSPLKPIIRIATEKDEEQAAGNKIREKEAFTLCRQKIIEHQLEMKLIDAEYTFDNSKILFYFTADGRIDFRDLVKDLAGVFRTRIELRQVGVRDETKIIGGIGICGRPLCCHSYLSDFVPVSIKMAKEQNLSLNPTKISGVCGRLMCCLNNEEEVYEEQNRKLPSVGDYVTTALGERGVVTNVNIFRETVKVLVQNGDEKELKEYIADDIRFKKHRKRGKIDLSPEELEQLKALEPDAIAELDADIEVAPQNIPANKPAHDEKADTKENHEGRENREARDNREPKDNHEAREHGDSHDNRNHRNNHGRGEGHNNHNGKNHNHANNHGHHKGANADNAEDRNKNIKVEEPHDAVDTPAEEKKENSGHRNNHNKNRRHYNRNRNHNNGKPKNNQPGADQT